MGEIEVEAAGLVLTVTDGWCGQRRDKKGTLTIKRLTTSEIR